MVSQSLILTSVKEKRGGSFPNGLEPPHLCSSVTTRGDTDDNEEVFFLLVACCELASGAFWLLDRVDAG
jgi:hypothetical protein